MTEYRCAREAIGAAARRLATFASELRSAHDDHGVAPGAIDDLNSPRFAELAAPIYEQSLGEDYLRRLGLTFGAVAVLMRLSEDRAPVVATNPRWGSVVAHLESVANCFAVDHRLALDQLPSLTLAGQPTPAVLRFDLLAALVTRPAVVRLFDAASWVAEVAPTLPEMADLEVDPISLHSLVSRAAT